MSDAEKLPPNMRSLMIIETLGLAQRPMTPTEIGTELDLPKQTIHRLCHRLVEEGFLVRVQGRRGLRPAKRSRDLALNILRSSHLDVARHSVLMQLARKVGETINFVMPGIEGMHYVDRVETDWPFRVQLPVGSHVPFHCTASGKTYLASLDAPNRKKLLRSLDLEKLTPNTIGDPNDLLTELEKIVDNGYALDNQEFMEGMIAIAVPVKNPQGQFMAALAFHGPTMRLSIEEASARLPDLREAAEKLGDLFE